VNVKTQNAKIEMGRSEILKGVDIAVENNEFVGLIGPNGSGKTTLLKCIYRTLKLSSGAVFINNEPLSTLTIRESAKKMAVMAQLGASSFDWTVLEMALMGRSPHKRAMEPDNAEDYRIVRDSLNKVGMADFEDRLWTTLSGGERQRVLLAQALSQQTPCLILDEPTNHLDVKFQLQLMNIVKNLGITVIAAIHDLNIAAMYCDRIYIIVNGIVVAQGTPEQVLTAENIREFYEVDSKIIYDEYAQMHILYRRQKKEQEINDVKDCNA
jgi:iron complex transport system ATP-binding protein